MTHSSPVWKLSLILSLDIIDAFEEFLAEDALVSGRFELDEDKGIWELSFYFNEKPSESHLKSKLLILKEMMPEAPTAYTLEYVEGANWIEKTLSSFKPLTIGRYYIRGSHALEKTPPSKIPLVMDASTAFGTGEHQSTAGCLMALDHIAKFSKKKRILDMGCGTGILAIAASLTFKQKALAVDIDPEAVRVTKKYIALNNLNGIVQSGVSIGYKNAIVAREKPFDLIFANILARPLCLMAKDAASKLTPGGHLILAGLLKNQKNKVLAAHALQGLKLEKMIDLDPWCTLVLTKRQ